MRHEGISRVNPALGDLSTGRYFYASGVLECPQNLKSSEAIFMMASKFSLILIGQYIMLACLFAWEDNWPKFFYWIGAAIIASSVLAM